MKNETINELVADAFNRCARYNQVTRVTEHHLTMFNVQMEDYLTPVGLTNLDNLVKSYLHYAIKGMATKLPGFVTVLREVQKVAEQSLQKQDGEQIWPHLVREDVTAAILRGFHCCLTGNADEVGGMEAVVLGVCGEVIETKTHLLTHIFVNQFDSISEWIANFAKQSGLIQMFLPTNVVIETMEKIGEQFIENTEFGRGFQSISLELENHLVELYNVAVEITGGEPKFVYRLRQMSPRYVPGDLQKVAKCFSMLLDA